MRRPRMQNCRRCTTEIEQLPTGSWVSAAGNAYCGYSATYHMLHEPIMQADWIEAIRRLAAMNPTFWTPEELARIMSLTVDQIKEVLNA